MGMLASGGRTLRTGTTGTAPAGRTAFGSVPGPIGVPQNIFGQLNTSVPNFGANTAGTSNVIGSELSGQVSPATLNALKTASAQFGVASGMPGSGLETNQLFGNIAGFSENRQRQGVQDYFSQAGTLGRLQTDPALAAEVSARNADLQAAPDPRLQHQQQIDDYLKAQATSFALSNPSRGPWWAPGGVNSPPIGATIGRSYAGGLPGGSPAFSTPDAFGYNFTNSEAGTTPVLGAINPSSYSGANAYQNWANLSRSWSTSPPNMAAFYPGIHDEPAYGPMGGGNSGEGDYVPDYPGQ